MIQLLFGLAGAAELSGLVQDPEGQPLEGALVVVYDARLGYALDETDAAGVFRIEGLPPNPYRVRVLPPFERNIAEQWWGGGLEYCEASAVLLAADSAVESLEIRLSAGGEIEGWLRHPNGAALADALVLAESAGTPLAEERVASTDAEGRFLLRGLPPEEGSQGSFHLRVAAEGLPEQYPNGGGYSPEGESPLVVAPGERIDVGTLQLLPGVVVGGAVLGPHGPLLQGSATVYSPSQTSTVPVVDGRYEARGLPPGEVIAWVEAEGLATTYAPDLSEPMVVRTIAEEGAVVDDVDIQLASEARLVGRVEGQGDLSSGSVLAYIESHRVGLGVPLAEDGSFEVGQLAAGRWEIFVYGAELGRVDDYLRDAAGERELLELEAGEESPPLIVDLPHGAQLSGVVRDRNTGAPIYGATITATGRDPEHHAQTSTDQEGRYELRGLPADAWTVAASYEHLCAADAGWTTRYHPDASWEGIAGPLLLGEGGVGVWDAALAPDGDHDAMGDAWELGNGLNPLSDDSAHDPDADGYSNLDEYLQGTDPLSYTHPPGSSCALGSAGYPPGPALSALALLLAAGRRRCA